VETLLADHPLLAIGAALAGGILSSASPCVLAIVPLVVGFVGGYADGDRRKAWSYSAAFVLGLSATFTAFGAAAAYLGTLFGDIGRFWPLAVAGLAVLMGLSLMGLFTVRLPFPEGLKTSRKGLLGALIMGLLFGLASSPCATPVLVVLLAFVAGGGDVLYGTLLLFAYALGHSVLLLVAGASAGLVEAFAKNRGLSGFSVWSRRLSGAAIALGGVYLFYQRW